MKWRFPIKLKLKQHLNPNQKLLLTILLFICCYQTGKTQLLSKSQMLSDLKQLEEDILEIHPGLQFYESTANLEQLFEETRNNLPDRLDRIDFLLQIAPLIDSLKCGHTGFNVYTQKKPKFLNKPKFKGLIPLHFVEVEDKVLIRRNMSNDTVYILPKSELLEINEEPIQTILNKLSQLGLGSDGNNQAGKRSYALKNFRLAYQMFYGERDSFDLKVRQIERDSIVHIRIAGKTVPEMTKTIMERYKLRPVSAFELRPVKDMEQVAILDLNRFTSTKFDPFQMGFRKRLKRVFKTLKANETEHLIIDLRNNPGGIVNNVVQLQKYIYDERFLLVHEARLNRKYYKSDASFGNKFSYFLRGVRKKKDHLRFRQYSGKRYRVKKKWGYDGAIIVLINEGSFSAACTFSLFAKSNDRAILLGEEAGGSYHIVSAGSSHISKLKHSKLNVRIPVVRFDYNVRADLQSPLQGVVPDIIVPKNLEDYLNGVDTQMEAAIDLIKKFEAKK